MTLDPYAQCPGGTGKKVKFCCPDMLSDLDKLVRMLQGDQRHACLDHVNKLLDKHPNRACLLAIKSDVLGQLGDMEQREQTLELFRQRHPENPVALADSAVVVASRQGPRAGIETLQRALDACAATKTVLPQVPRALASLALLLDEAGHPAAAQSHASLAWALDPDDDDLLTIYLRLLGNDRLPQWFKEDWPLEECPDDVPWKNDYLAVLQWAGEGRLLAAAERLTGLSQQVTDAPLILRTLARLRLKLADHPGALRALRKLVALDIPLDDAIEAELLIQVLHSSNIFGELVETRQFTYPVRDLERLLALLAANPATPAGFSERAWGEDSPPPRGEFLLLDRPLVAYSADCSIDDLPRHLASLFVFGRQTDREARLELVLTGADEIEAIAEPLAAVVGDTLGEVAGSEVVASLPRLEQEFRRRPFALPGVPRRTYMEWHEQHVRRVTFERWPHIPLKALDGKTPVEAATDPAQRARLYAAALNVASAIVSVDIDREALFEKLGLPPLPPLDPTGLDVSKLSHARLVRLDVPRLSDDQLITVLRRAIVARNRFVLRAATFEALGRESCAQKIDRDEALGTLALVTYSPREIESLLDRARSEAQSVGRSCARWDLYLVQNLMTLDDADRLIELFRHIQAQHGNEPGVLGTLHRIAQQAGIVQADAAPTSPAPSAPAAEPPASGAIWTPGSELPAGGRDQPAGGREKPVIWTPGMD